MCGLRGSTVLRLAQLPAQSGEPTHDTGRHTLRMPACSAPRHFFRAETRLAFAESLHLNPGSLLAGMLQV
ncbi:hypothetical protein M878_14260 [Streptomyces roseochromogenus subsp. oscitans DS 12.976]|uniref:Uncharacterized protein n=1 Tax=Streptomyces roseochromogenus subsp. oscitans DS 12.976 TaxID=1352936 RepID=V6KUT1_STRRC|nr:hypothetical protein M878_14260 [Streptomyces roseochromogenus subsp. oscitans DS 12.976]